MHITFITVCGTSGACFIIGVKVVFVFFVSERREKKMLAPVLQLLHITG